MKWVTRERPKTDRIACPWLIKNLIDPEAEFLYVPAEQVLETAERENANSYAAPGARYTHRDGLCSFEVLVEEYNPRRPRVHGDRQVRDERYGRSCWPARSNASTTSASTRSSGTCRSARPTRPPHRECHTMKSAPHVSLGHKCRGRQVPCRR